MRCGFRWILHSSFLSHFPWLMLSTSCGGVAFPTSSISQMRWTTMSSARPVSWVLSFWRYASFSCPFLSFCIFLYTVILKCAAHVRLVLLLVALLTPLIFPSQFILMALTALLRSILWDVTKMSCTTLFQRVHKRWALFHPCLFFFFFWYLSTLVLTLSSFQI